MNELTKTAEALDFNILKNCKKEVFDSYTLGQRSPKLNAANDLDYIMQLNKSFFHYYTNIINQLPENEQPLERLKCKVVQEQVENSFKILSYQKNILDKNNFLFYNVAYVSDIIKRNSSINNEG